MKITRNPSGEQFGLMDPGAWPFLGEASFVHAMAAWTQALATKLANADADVAGAINAAQTAQTAAATLNGHGTLTTIGLASNKSITNTTVEILATTISSGGTTQAWRVDAHADTEWATNSAIVVVELFVDGVAKTDQLIGRGPASMRLPLHKTWTLTNLDSRTHTISLRAHCDQGTQTIYSSHTTITIERTK